MQPTDPDHGGRGLTFLIHLKPMALRCIFQNKGGAVWVESSIFFLIGQPSMSTHTTTHRKDSVRNTAKKFGYRIYISLFNFNYITIPNYRLSFSILTVTYRNEISKTC